MLVTRGRDFLSIRRFEEEFDTALGNNKFLQQIDTKLRFTVMIKCFQLF